MDRFRHISFRAQREEIKKKKKKAKIAKLRGWLTIRDQTLGGSLRKELLLAGGSMNRRGKDREGFRVINSLQTREGDCIIIEENYKVKINTRVHERRQLPRDRSFSPPYLRREITTDRRLSIILL